MIGRRFAGAGPVALGLLALLGPGRAEGQVALAPQVGTIPDGVALTAVPAVSADRRYVRLSVNAGFQTVDGFTTVPIPFGVSGLGMGAGVGGVGGPGGGNLGGLGGQAGAGGPAGVAGVAMGMDGPASGPHPAGLARAVIGPATAADFPFPTADAPAGSFDHSFRAAPSASPARKAPKSARSQRQARVRNKPIGP